TPGMASLIAEMSAGLALAIIANLFAAAWHKFVLRGERPLKWSHLFGREWRRFNLYTLIIYIPLLPAGLLGAALADPAADPDRTLVYADLAASLLALGFLIYVFRASLIFPAAAYGRPLRWREAARRLRGNSWRLLGCGLLVFAPLGVLEAMLLWPSLPDIGGPGGSSLAEPAAGLTARAALAGNGIATILEFIGIALGAAMLCNFYRRIVLADAPQ
ncbi:MAG: hypothetical protein JO010_04895, partial [Alphaproteobacteria bacterium]|nr:hypothetical protein [Alphaproteobacteria bacterium]